MKSLKIYIAITIGVFIIGCNKIENDRNNGSPNIRTEIKAFYSLQNRIAAEFQATLSDTITDEFAHSDRLLEWILQQPEVVEAEMPFLYVFDVKHTNGFSGNILFSPKETDVKLFTRGGNGMTDGKLYNFQKSDDEKIITNKNVLIILQYAEDFYAPYCTEPNAKDIQTHLDLYKYSNIDFNVTLKVDEGISAFLDLSDYGIIIFNTHGTPTGLASGTNIFRADNLDAFSDDVEVASLPNGAESKLRNGELKLTSFWEYEKATKKMAIKDASYELTFSFFQSLPVQFDNTVLIGNYCYSGIRNGIMGNVLEPKGLITFYGYGYENGKSSPVSNDLAWRAEDIIISNLIARDSTGIAHLVNNTTQLQDDEYWNHRYDPLLRSQLAERYSIYDPQTWNHYLDPSYRFKVCEGDSAIVDSRDGEVYNSVKIGNQRWFTENLRYENGMEPATYIEWKGVYSSGGGNPTYEPAWLTYSGYGDDEALNGNLYNWYLVNSTNLCPSGWHVPNDADWQELVDFLGGGLVAGGKMKTITHWAGSNTGATNESCFSAIPSGWLNFNTVSLDWGKLGLWWSATAGDHPDQANLRWISYDSAEIRASVGWKAEGHSCRCVED